MGNPKCNLPAGEREAVLGLFRGTLTPEEEGAIRRMFPQYLFFRNEYEDDGWNVSSDPLRICTCTACGESFEAVRGNYARGRLHNEECNCPSCGARVTGKAVYKYRYEMHSLESWIKTAVAYPSEGGAVLIEAGNARRTFSWDDLTGTIDWYPCARYYFGKGIAQGWKEKVLTWAWCGEEKEIGWIPTDTICEPFLPNMMGNVYYEGQYSIVGLPEALEASELRYCQIMDFYEYEYAAKLYELDTARWMVKYLGWYCHHPQIEMAVKLGISGAVCELVQDGRKNARLLDWNGTTPAELLRMSKQDARTFRMAGFDFSDLKTFRILAGKMGLGRYMSLVDQAGGSSNLQRIAACAGGLHVPLEKAVRYIRSQEPQCARMAVPLSYIIQHWEDYLRLARQLEYDLTEPTVAMPRDLQARHDAAAEIAKNNADETEKKKYAKRKKQLEKRFAFGMDGMKIVIPGSAREIVDEGQTLHHCVGGYAARHVAGSTTILFLRHARRPERSFLTIELYEDKGRWKIRQIHGYRNEGYALAEGKRKPDPGTKYAWFLDTWLEWVNDGSRRDKNGRPVLPEIEEVKTA